MLVMCRKKWNLDTELLLDTWQELEPNPPEKKDILKNCEDIELRQFFCWIMIHKVCGGGIGGDKWGGGKQQQQQEGQPTFSTEDFMLTVAVNIRGVQGLCVGWVGCGSMQ
jgi:hypothetical protein